MNPNPPWPNVDPLGAALHYLRMDGVFYNQCEFGGTWGLRLPAFANSLMFHAVTAGSCELEVPGAPSRSLRAGDFVLVPHGEGHSLLSHTGATAANLFDLEREQISESFEVIRLGDAEPTVRMVCGAVRFDHPAGQRLVSLLPPLIHLDSINTPADGMNDLLRFMAAEVRRLRPGGEAVITRLADILVIQAIRAWLASEGNEQVGWIHAMRDRQIGRALALIHQHPERAWTLNTLADAVAMSRSAFAERFTQLVGEPAMQYVTQWRMNTAYSMLREQNISIGDLAARLGYQSEAAFNRMFKRVIGKTPGAVRREGLGAESA